LSLSIEQGALYYEILALTRLSLDDAEDTKWATKNVLRLIPQPTVGEIRTYLLKLFRRITKVYLLKVPGVENVSINITRGYNNPVSQIRVTVAHPCFAFKRRCRPTRRSLAIFQGAIRVATAPYVHYSEPISYSFSPTHAFFKLTPPHAGLSPDVSYSAFIKIIEHVIELCMAYQIEETAAFERDLLELNAAAPLFSTTKLDSVWPILVNTVRNSYPTIIISKEEENS